LEQIERFRRHQVEMPEIGLSSTEIRKRVAAGRSVRYRTPRAVEKYIQTRALYLGENLV
jgi:nicotinate-nucleotide adenylyltransferase